MSKNTLEEVESLTDVYDEEITNEDYGLVFDKDGDLKSVFMPTEYFVIPEKILAIFKALGIEDPETILVHSVH